MKTVYLLEDDNSICELLSCSLEMLGIQFYYFNTVKKFKEALEKEQPAVALLDVMLPDGDGFEVLKDIKTRYPQIICMMLSAKNREADKVRGLNLGADDYITKPFSVLELAARLNAALRRIPSKAVLLKGGISLNEETFTVVMDGKNLELNNKEFFLLKYLMQNAGKALTREEILIAVWGYESGETRTVDNHIARLRRMGIEGIETVFGIGYKFVGGNNTL